MFSTTVWPKSFGQNQLTLVTGPYLMLLLETFIVKSLGFLGLVVRSFVRLLTGDIGPAPQVGHTRFCASKEACENSSLWLIWLVYGYCLAQTASTASLTWPHSSVITLNGGGGFVFNLR